MIFGFGEMFNPCSNNFKPLYRKPILQQAFSNYSWVLYHHSKTNGGSLTFQNRTTQRFEAHGDQCSTKNTNQFSANSAHQSSMKGSTQFWKVLENPLVNREGFRNNFRFFYELRHMVNSQAKVL